jgi:phosphotransferase system enzyme I (PtsP)
MAVISECVMAKIAGRKLLDRTAELTRLLDESTNLKVFMTDLAKLVAAHMEADACSFFIYDEGTDELVLQGTAGLDPSFVGRLRFKSGEGITGAVMKNLEPIKADYASSHPNFKPFQGIGEEQYESLMAIPIRRARVRIGVITLHKHEANYFDDEDISVLMAIASQIASSVLSAGLLLALRDHTREQVHFDSPIQGTGASPGIIYGRSLFYNRQQFSLPESVLDEDQHPERHYTLEDFDRAIDQTVEQLHQIEEHLGENLSDIAGLIFTAHYLMLKDPQFTGMMRERIEQGMDVDDSIRSVADEYAHLMSQIDNPRIQEKEQDVRDLEHRLLANLYDADPEHRDYSDNVIFASTIYPSELVRFWVQKAKGIVLIGQGLTAHISILARSLNIPLLLTGHRGLFHLPNNTEVIADAAQGVLHINPDYELVSTYAEISSRRNRAKAEEDIPEQTYTTDGQRVLVNVNVNILHDAEAGFMNKAEGIGLYRTEFPFLIQNSFPTEEQQVQVYEKICALSGEREVVLRTLDIGGDKLPGYVDIIEEDNPFLGFRGIRYSLEASDIFYEQIRAMLRAAANSKLSILFPMISSIEEFDAGRQTVVACMDELEKGGYEYCRNPRIGAMVEIPSAVEFAADLAQRADFLSIGTNDLIMYLLAVDRSNEYVGHMHTALHPAVLRTLKRLTDQVQSVSADPAFLSVCGNAAADPLVLPFFLGIGIYNLSVEAAALPAVKKQISTLSASDCRRLASELLEVVTREQIDRIIERFKLSYEKHTEVGRETEPE